MSLRTPRLLGKGFKMGEKYQRAVTEKDQEFARAFARLIMQRMEKDELERGEQRAIGILMEVGASAGVLMVEKRMKEAGV